MKKTSPDTESGASFTAASQELAATCIERATRATRQRGTAERHPRRRELVSRALVAALLCSEWKLAREAYSSRCRRSRGAQLDATAVLFLILSQSHIIFLYRYNQSTGEHAGYGLIHFLTHVIFRQNCLSYIHTYMYIGKFLLHHVY